MALCFISGLGPKTILKILRFYPRLENFEAALKNKQLNPKLGALTIEKIKTDLDISKAEKIINYCQLEKINILTYLDENYPYLLKQIFDPPIILFWRGDQSCLRYQNFLAAVGTRKISPYARQIMPGLLRPISSRKIIIVSGLARGVDSLAHQIAVDCRQPTIAVLGSGIDRRSFYPGENFPLAEKIIQNHGLIFSEYPPGTGPCPENFPRRNRIISGLCQATLVIEAAARSGSLITAYQALEQNREIMAIPGNICLTNSQGTNKLLQHGARLISDSQDILDFYRISPEETKIQIDKLSPPEKQILDCLRCGALTVEKIQQSSKMDIVTLNATLSLLEIQGYIKTADNTYYSLGN